MLVQNVWLQWKKILKPVDSTHQFNKSICQPIIAGNSIKRQRNAITLPQGNDGQNSLLKIDFYFQNKNINILYFQNAFGKYFVKVFLKN